MKDCVDVFEINVDISDVSSLYDYVTCQTIKRSGKVWSKDELADLGNIKNLAQEDEHLILQVNTMDKMFADKRFFQVLADEKAEPAGFEKFQGFDSYEDTLDLPRRVLPMYIPGEVVKGTVVLTLNNQVKADNLTLNFLGSAVMNIRTYTQHGYYDNTRHERYIDQSVSLWEKSDGKDPKDSFKNLVVNDSPARGPVLPPGTHKFPFEFTIPTATSSSTPNIHPGSVHYAYVVYRLMAKLGAGKFLGSGDVLTHKGIWVNKEYDIGADLENLKPITIEESLETGIINRGKITVRASLPRKAFVIGESIPLKCEIDNQAADSIVLMSAYINMHGKFRTSESRCSFSKKVHIKSNKFIHENIASGMCPNFDIKLDWDFSESSVDNNLMPTGILDDCTLIDVKYDIIIHLKRGKLSRNMEVEIPIYIGDYNSQE